MNAPVKLDKCLNIQQVLSQFDNIKLKHFSLPCHAIAELPEHDRELYFCQLAMLLLAGGSISANQQRLLQLLLPTMGLASKLPTLMARAQQLEQKDLETGIEQLKEKELTKTFIVDTLVLCRLEQPLNQDQCQILAELVALLELHHADMEHLSQVAALILGLPQADKLPSNFNPDPLKLDCWEEFLYRELTAEHLQAGVHNGYWRISKSLSIEFPFTLDNIKIVFTQNGKLTVKAIGDINLNNLLLVNPVISIHKNDWGNLSIYNCKIEGAYPKNKKLSALTIDGLTSTIERTHFKTKDARALRAISGKIKIKECTFDECGNSELVGGGVSSRAEILCIIRTSFSNCKAKIAGGIRATHADIKNCKLEKCNSQYIKECDFDLENREKSVAFGHNAGGVFLNNIKGEHDIEQCEFEDSSVKVVFKQHYDLMRNCKMLDSTLAVDDSSSHIYCEQNARKSINRVYLGVFSGTSGKVPYQSWWDDF
ncbi:hypothetical protein [Oceanimonas baumannii]|uniref:Right handed beta helix domain-containing protein n=1 Tax=Oceanimonas baumannii TaxID=129578 RepID=A0A235CMD6_9GAMM|nr:hypothetical protein [Oceanimonas baumannii]OYD25731.1 hypothetical protein B6S09_02500 [Oceanimonas baumannii]TDW60265.1 hypothetical protein LY04_01261 [Oceanimonas baumannii]